MDKYRVTLTAEEQVGLQQLVSTGKAAARKLTHARILLLADTHGESLSDEEIVAALGTSFRTVARVRQWLVTQSLLAALDRKAQPLAARAHVAAQHHAPARRAVFRRRLGDQRREGMPHRLGHLVGQLGGVQAADVVLAEDVGRDAHEVLCLR